MIFHYFPVALSLVANYYSICIVGCYWWWLLQSLAYYAISKWLHFPHLQMGRAQALRYIHTLTQCVSDSRKPAQLRSCEDSSRVPGMQPSKKAQCSQRVCAGLMLLMKLPSAFFRLTHMVTGGGPTNSLGLRMEKMISHGQAFKVTSWQECKRQQTQGCRAVGVLWSREFSGLHLPSSLPITEIDNPKMWVMGCWVQCVLWIYFFKVTRS